MPALFPPCLPDGAAEFWHYPCLTLDPAQSTNAAVREMREKGTSFALVLEGDRILGILTERDIVRLVSSQLDLSQLPLSDAIERNVIVVRDSDLTDIFQIAKLFTQHGVRHLPVVDRSEKLLGVLTPWSVSGLMTPEHLLRNIRIKDALHPTLVVAQETDSILNIAQRMTEAGASCVAIVEQSNSYPVGIITERDITQFHALGFDMSATTAATVMSQPLFTVQLDDLLWSALEIMQDKRVRKLIVVRPDGELAGLVTQAGIVKLLNPAELNHILEQLQAIIDRQTKQLRDLNQNLLQLNDELQRQASQDSLTQLSNRRHFDAYLSDVWQRLSREPTELTLLVCDVDCFKAYNDLYGHLEGDTCLRLIAQSIQQVVRSSTDMVARYGGEEFALILPKCDVRGAKRAAQTILERIRKLNIPHAGSGVTNSISLSIGAATVAFPSASEPRSVLKLADQKLYESKRLGRDRASFGIVNSSN